ncbi:MAG: phosphotransferase, partial [Verrucomicrobiota bacterium]|nr:phosphotransferase [Verrucomicrobiota bacterium]
ELVEGETLEALVQREGPLPVGVALDVVAQVARALLAAEAHALIHRDLKPSNLMVLGAGAGATEPLLVKVIDFGLAKAAAAVPATGLAEMTFSGTPGFASPEQLRGGDAGWTRAPTSTRSAQRSAICFLGARLWKPCCLRQNFPRR